MCLHVPKDYASDLEAPPFIDYYAVCRYISWPLGIRAAKVTNECKEERLWLFGKIDKPVQIGSRNRSTSNCGGQMLRMERINQRQVFGREIISDRLFTFSKKLRST